MTMFGHSEDRRSGSQDRSPSNRRGTSNRATPQRGNTNRPADGKPTPVDRRLVPTIVRAPIQQQLAELVRWYRGAYPGAIAS